MKKCVPGYSGLLALAVVTCAVLAGALLLPAPGDGPASTGHRQAAVGSPTPADNLGHAHDRTRTAGPTPTAAVPSPVHQAEPVGRNSPYFYLGWGNPQDPLDIMRTTGTKHFALAFVTSDGSCDPVWDDTRPLNGGPEAQAITRIRAAGGDVMVSFGGWSGRKLGQACGSAEELAGAYQKVIDAYRLRAIDIDIEADEARSADSRANTIDALKIVKEKNPGIKEYVTFSAEPDGPDENGLALINRAASVGVEIDGWVAMTFDFGAHRGSMAAVTTTCADGVARAVRDAYGYDRATAYAHTGISSMNGITDTSETVTLADYRTIVGYASAHHLARLSFWAVNRDRACPPDNHDGDACSGIGQEAYVYGRALARYHG
ncbi:chitinase [Streptomyces lunalinharesii]|uniref:GH18 domain-containing protein n=1 Tax=Streptomyces lunalinharesii TaxID=333384 RepID=A0ABN3SLM6_9ACTN